MSHTCEEHREVQSVRGGDQQHFHSFPDKKLEKWPG
jgi:hypothetical protein